MLAIRMQRTGRKGYPTYRVIVQESHRQPTSGRVVANIGSYNPHTKVSTLDKEKAATFLKNGAQPSDRVVKLLQAEKVVLPDWVKVTSDKKQKTIKHAEKLRRNQPEEEKAVEPAVEAAPTEAVEEVAQTPEAAVADAPVEEPKLEAPSEAKDDTEDETPAQEPAAETAVTTEVASDDEDDKKA